jgi:hypothetical protein
MRDYSGYVSVSHGEIPQSKLKKVIKGGKLTFTKEELAGNVYKTLFHPATAKMLKLAQRKGKGANAVPVATGEIMADMDWHNSSGSGMQGGSIWRSIWNGIKSLWNPVIKPALSQALDMGVAPLQGALAGSKYGAPLAPFVPNARAKFKELTGIGMTTQQKRLKALEKARASKKNKKINILTGSSFRIN